jgi:hypothetical protein
VLTVFNKIDALDPPRLDALRAQQPDALFVSALTGEGIDALIARVASALPESPFLYPEDDIAEQPVRFFASELIRETALEQLEQEVPYSIACTIEEFREERRPVYIRAVLYVERDSQKRIVIGEGGARIREIGRASREKIEALIDAPVYLDLWVKVLPNWRRDSAALRRLGFTHTDEETRPRVSRHSCSRCSFVPSARASSSTGTRNSASSAMRVVFDMRSAMTFRSCSSMKRPRSESAAHRDAQRKSSVPPLDSHLAAA